jgi:hypothetical protein
VAPPVSAELGLGRWAKTTALRVFQRVMPKTAGRWQAKQRARQAEQRLQAEVDGVVAVANRSEDFPFVKQIGKPELGRGRGHFGFMESLGRIDPSNFTVSTPSQRVRFAPSEALVKQTIADSRLVFDQLKRLGQAGRYFAIDRHSFRDVALAAMEAAARYTKDPNKLLSVGRYAMHEMAQIAMVSEAPSIFHQLAVQLAVNLHQSLDLIAGKKRSMTDLLGELGPDGLIRPGKPVTRVWSWIPEQLHNDGTFKVDIAFAQQGVGANGEHGVLFRQRAPELRGQDAVQISERYLTAVTEQMSASTPLD